jgi:hypothetical protein
VSCALYISVYLVGISGPRHYYLPVAEFDFRGLGGNCVRAGSVGGIQAALRLCYIH